MKKISRSLTSVGKKEMTIKSTEDTDSNLKPVCLNFSDLPTDERTSLLAHVVCGSTLPISVRIAKNFAAKDAAIALKSGEILLLCFVIKLENVHATVRKAEYRLPLHCTQLFEPLPIDPLLDDKSYKGTKAVIEASPLPEMIRVVDAEYSPDPMADQDAGDVIKVRRVEVQEHPERGRERVLVGYDSRDKEVHFSEAMDMASYSTMISQDLLPLSELVKFDMPQRVRMPEATTSDSVEPKRNKAKEKVMKLHRLYIDYHVIAAREKGDDLLSIPINSSIEFEIVNSTLEDIARVLPAIFNRTNSTWCVSDITQPRMPESLCAVPQPIEGVFEAWAKSYEGKKRINQKYEVNVNYMKKKIEERDKEIRQLKKQIAYPTAAPALTSRPMSVPGVVPPRPPREYRTLEPSILTSAIAGLKPKPLPRPKPKANPYDTLPIKTAPVVDEEKSKLQATIQQLQKDLYEKETKIFELLNAEGKQKERYEMLRKERDEMKISRAADRQQILQLQTTIDHLHNVQDGALYEELDEVVPTTKDTTLYSNPYTGMKVNKQMSISDVCDFLRQIGLSEYVGVFTNEKIDGLMLQHLDEDIMTSDLSMRRIDARRLMTKMKQIK